MTGVREHAQPPRIRELHPTAALNVRKTQSILSFEIVFVRGASEQFHCLGAVARNAALVTMLCRQCPAGSQIRLWALDAVDPALAAAR